MGLYGIRESEAVRQYDKQYPGVDIPPEQKHERVERRASRERHGVSTRPRRATVGSFVVSKLWPGHPDYEEPTDG